MHKLVSSHPTMTLSVQLVVSAKTLLSPSNCSLTLLAFSISVPLFLFPVVSGIKSQSFQVIPYNHYIEITVHYQMSSSVIFSSQLVNNQSFHFVYNLKICSFQNTLQILMKILQTREYLGKKVNCNIKTVFITMVHIVDKEVFIVDIIFTQCFINTSLYICKKCEETVF